ncbi:MAG: excinuclease ABC subunit UvrA [Fimbriimonadaceae bacterium]|nr:excinuclease ABC subunit UvrA [Fimbriimonadaceae bacterium]
MSHDKIVVLGARENNLKNINVEIPRDKLVVITGLSGSGKSSLAFDTIYAEGQRRYVESLSAYARQFLGQMDKPDVDHIEGLSPAISIDQKSTSRNPRSTVGTVTEIYDYLRILYARAGVPHCINGHGPIERQSLDQIVDAVLELPEGTKLQIMAPIIRGRKGEYKSVIQDIAKQGYVRVRVDGQMYEVTDDIPMERYKQHTIEVVVDRIVLKEGIDRRLTDSVEAALKLAKGMVTISHTASSDQPSKIGDQGSEIRNPKSKIQKPKTPSSTHGPSPLRGEVSERSELGGGDNSPDSRLTTHEIWIDKDFSESYACNECGFSMSELEPRMFSFNSPYGACPECTGLGTKTEFDPNLVIPDMSKPLRDGAIVPFVYKSGEVKEWWPDVLDGVGEALGFDASEPVSTRTAEEMEAVWHGLDKPVTVLMRYSRTERKFQSKWDGVLNTLKKKYEQTESEWVRKDLEQYMSTKPCPTCQGRRLKPETLNVKLDNKDISEITTMSVEVAHDFFDKLPKKLSKRQMAIGDRAIKEIIERLRFLVDVGVGYLTLDRSARTLAGGEAQRIRLATQIGSGLMGCLYILDEPSIGLHQRDNRKLIDTLIRLRDMGNTVIVVEHDEETMMAADWLIDLGPGAGEHGGEIINEGPTKEFLKKNVGTARWLNGKLQIATPKERRQPKTPNPLLPIKNTNGKPEKKVAESKASFGKPKKAKTKA